MAIGGLPKKLGKTIGGIAELEKNITYLVCVSSNCQKNITSLCLTLIVEVLSALRSFSCKMSEPREGGYGETRTRNDMYHFDDNMELWRSSNFAVLPVKA